MKINTKSIQGILFEPNTFFKSLSEKKDFKPAIAFYAALTIFAAVINISTFLLTAVLVTKVPLTPSDAGRIITSSLLGVAVGVALSFLWAFLLHSWLKIFKAKGDFTKTYQIFAYSSAPSLLLGWVPLANILASVYGLYLVYISTTILHKMSKKTALISYALLLAIAIGLQYLYKISQ